MQGVMKCTLCKGDAWKNKISFAKVSRNVLWVGRKRGVLSVGVGL